MSMSEFNRSVDINGYGGVKFQTVSGGKLSSTKKTFTGVVTVEGADIKGLCVCKFR